MTRRREQNIYGVVADATPIDAGRRLPDLERSTLDTLLLNLAYISYVTASLMPSGLKLRLGLIAQSIAFITWGVVSGTPTTVAWNILFISINIYKAVRIVRRDAVTLTAGEEAVRIEIFPDLNRRAFLQLWATGRGDEALVDERLCREGSVNVDLFLLTKGDVKVTTSSGLERTRTATCFIGEMSFLSGDAASADVVAATPVGFRRWNQDDLRALELLNHDCSRALQDAMALDITRKLRDETASGPPSSPE